MIHALLSDLMKCSILLVGITDLAEVPPLFVFVVVMMLSMLGAEGLLHGVVLY
jgi:hypothetical protein